MNLRGSTLFLRRFLAALCAMASIGVAQAQTPVDVANGIASVAVEVLTLPKAQWALGLNGSLNEQRGSTSSHASSLMAYGLRNTDSLTYGGLITGSRTSYSNADSGFSVGLNGALEYRFGPRWSLLNVVQFNRSPSNYLERQSVVSPLAVYRFDSGKDTTIGIYAGPGFADQRLTITIPGGNDRFVILQAGAVYRNQLNKDTSVTATVNRAFQRGDRENNTTSGQLKLDTKLWGGVGLQTSYLIARDDEPFIGRSGTNQTLRVSLTVLFSG